MNLLQKWRRARALKHATWEICSSPLSIKMTCKYEVRWKYFPQHNEYITSRFCGLPIMGYVTKLTTDGIFIWFEIHPEVEFELKQWVQENEYNPFYILLDRIRSKFLTPRLNEWLHIQMNLDMNFHLFQPMYLTDILNWIQMGHNILFFIKGDQLDYQFMGAQ